MKKRNIIIFAFAVAITEIIVSTIISNILKIPEEIVLIGILIFMLFILCLRILLPEMYNKYLEMYNKYLVHKFYKDLIENEKKIKILEHEKYKTYFVLDSSEREEKIKQYDEMLEEAYKRTKIEIQILKEYKEYLSKKKYTNVIEIEEQIRKTSRA